MPGHNHGKSIKNPRVYEALRRKGYSKSKAAAISNAMVGRTKKRSSMPTREYRQAPVEFNLDDDHEGRITADVVKYFTLDDYGTRFASKCFTESLEKRMPKICWAHNWNDPIGMWKDADDNEDRLRLTGELDLETRNGQNIVPNAHRAYVQLNKGTITDFSVGFVRQRDMRSKAVPGATDILKALLDEVSPVLIGSVPGSKLVSIRSRSGSPRLTRAGIPADTSLWVPAEAMQDILVRFERGELDLGDSIGELKRLSVTYDELPDEDEDYEPTEEEIEEAEEELEEDDPVPDIPEDLDAALRELGLEVGT